MSAPLPSPGGGASQVEAPPSPPTFAQALVFWFQLGCISFGGPAGQIATMHAELVERRRWVSESRFANALNYCMILPGPEAQQLATYMGWIMHRTWGGIAAGALFVLPSAVLLWVLGWVYVSYGSLPWLRGAFDGFQPAVVAIVAAAVIRLGRRATKTPLMVAVALLAFVALFVLKAPFPMVLLSAAAVGLLSERFWPGRVTADAVECPSEKKQQMSPLPVGEVIRPSLLRSMKVLALCVVLWGTPLLILAAWLGNDHTVVRQGLFFSKAALVTFGGAYALLPYVSQQAVDHYGWVSSGQMMDGLGLAEATPGPLIMVVQFVGFLGAWRFHDPLSPLTAATLGAFVTTWVTFLPSFLWIFLGAPYIEIFRKNRMLSAALSAITAAVVGVILNLALWMGWHVLLLPAGQANVFGIAVCLISLVALQRWKWSVIGVMLVAGSLGLVKAAIVRFA